MVGIKTGKPEVGDVIYELVGREKEKVFKKLVKEYSKEEDKYHVYVIRPKFKNAIFKNERFCYKTVVTGFYRDTQFPIYKHFYIDLIQGRAKIYEADKKAWCDLSAQLINRDALPPTDKDRVAILEKEVAKFKAVIEGDKALAKKIAKSSEGGEELAKEVFEELGIKGATKIKRDKKS